MPSDHERPYDPTRVGDQPALRTRSGSNWLAWGAVTAVVVAAVMVLMAVRAPAVGWPALAVVVALFAAMVVVRAAVRPRRARLVALAVLDLGIVVVGLVAVLVVLFSAPSAVWSRQPCSPAPRSGASGAVRRRPCSRSADRTIRSDVTSTTPPSTLNSRV